MHAIHLVLSLYVFTLIKASPEPTFGTSHNVHLLPDGFSALGNYEVLSVHEEADEDVVRIRKRAGEEDCGSDCLNFSGWTYSGQMEECEIESEDIGPEEDGMEKRSRLEARARKKPTLTCDQVVIDGSPRGGFDLISPTWPTRQGIVYDTGDPTEPLKPEWFEMKRRDKRWTKDIVGRKNPNPKNQNRCYDAEHVLEWHLLKDFIEEDMEKSDKSRCALLWKFFIKTNMPKTNHKVKVAKDNGKLNTQGNFIYEDEDYDFSKWAHDKNTVPTTMDWISFQWPGTKGGSPPNPWEYELVILSHDANMKKKNIWSGESLFVEPGIGNDNKMSRNKANSDTLEWRYENKYYDSDSKTMKDYTDNTGRCKAVHQYMTVMSLAQYHNDDYIKEIMRAQVRRVGEAFEYLEKNILVGTQWPKPNNPPEIFQERGLKDEWLEYMKNKHKKELDRLNKVLEDKLPIFEGQPGVDLNVKRWDYGGVFRRAEPVLNCGKETDAKKMEKRVELLKDFKKQTFKPVESKLEL